MLSLLDYLVLRQRVVHTWRLDGDGRLPSQCAHNQCDATSERVTGEHNLAPGFGELPRPLQDLVVLPLVVSDAQGGHHAVLAADDQSRRLPRPSPRQREEGVDDREHHRLCPHPDVLQVVNDAVNIRAADRDDTDGLRTDLVACQLKLHPRPLPDAGAVRADDGDVVVGHEGTEKARHVVRGGGLDVGQLREEGIVKELKSMPCVAAHHVILRQRWLDRRRCCRHPLQSEHGGARVDDREARGRGVPPHEISHEEARSVLDRRHERAEAQHGAEGQDCH
mmetsp:Transcript_66501/g.191160  ORF Transcript_66501/g.191160 Transcript_66501/m.191160 type:complete len:279 (+) Transcript_66501:930-1766(+)